MVRPIDFIGAGGGTCSKRSVSEAVAFDFYLLMPRSNSVRFDIAQCPLAPLRKKGAGKPFGALARLGEHAGLFSN
jgi:hypothetical protein